MYTEVHMVMHHVPVTCLELGNYISSCYYYFIFNYNVYLKTHFQSNAVKRVKLQCMLKKISTGI
jgi:hypothetical protein